MQNEITKEKLEKYLSITKKALSMAKGHFSKENAEIIYDMAERYYKDAMHFMSKDDYINAFASINYAHGWLDCGARMGYFDVHDSKIFTVDD